MIYWSLNFLLLKAVFKETIHARVQHTVRRNSSPQFLFCLWQCLAILFALALSFATVQAEVAVPTLNARVTDTTNTLTSVQRAALERTLADFERRKGAQIAILIVPTTKPETVQQYAVRAFEAAKVGRAKVNDGVLLLIAKDDREMHIEVGYGLEGAIPDAIANRVIDEVILPFFKQGDFYSGVEAGVNRLIRLVEGEPLPSPRERDHSWNGLNDLLPMLFIAVFVIGGILRTIFGRFIGASIASGVVGVVAWSMVGLLIAIPAAVVVFLMVLIGSANRFGGFGGGMGGGGWGGGWSSGGGSWSGGGGTSGGGGASGKW